MSRPTRIRRQSSKLSTADFVINIPKIITKSTKEQKPTTELHSKKGINNKLINSNVLLPLSSNILRDRTNLIKEPNTKLDVLKKGFEDKNAADVDVKMLTGVRTKRTRANKAMMNEDMKNIRDINETKMQKITRNTAKSVNGKILKTKSVAIVSTSIGLEEDTQPIVTATRVTRNSMKNDAIDSKLSVIKIKRTKKVVLKQELQLTTRTHTQKNSDSIDKSKFSLREIPENKLKIPTKLSVIHDTIGHQSIKQLTRSSANKINNKSINKNNEEEIFKSKLKTPGVIPSHSKISTLKRPLINKTRKATANRKNANQISALRSSMSFRLRQSTLNESFSAQSKKNLRPRKTVNNNNEKSQTVDKTKKKNKLDNIDEKKGPVYKSIENIDDNNTDKEKVYDFIFDVNDSNERAPRKRRKRIIRKRPAKKAKIMTTELKTKPSKSTKLSTKKIDVPIKISKLSATKILDKNDMNDDNELTTAVTTEIHEPLVEITCESDEPESNKIPELVTIITNAHARPKIISDEKLTEDRCINLTVTPPQLQSKGDKLLPLNQTNKFNGRPSVQLKTMMDASLIRRSLSPIAIENSKENFETNSPWRPPSMNTFSRVKNIFQSTPQGKKFTKLLGKASLTAGLTRKIQGSKMTKITEQNNENANVLLIKKSPEINQTNISKSPRKFGTVISNINNNSPIKQQSLHINTSKSPRKFGTVISNINETLSNTNSIENVPTKLSIPVVQSTTFDLITVNLPDNNEITQLPDKSFSNKENLAPNENSGKSSGERTITANTDQLQLEKPNELYEHKCEKVFEPQPGPSGLQKSYLSAATWTKKQSNLNKFLNLPDIPKSTEINTTHGIFDDVHSTSMNGKTKKKITTGLLDVNNAFGFDDDDDDENTDEIDISPINKIDNELIDKIIPGLTKTNGNIGTKPARFSVAEIKKTLLPTKSTENNKNKLVSITNDKYVEKTKKDVVQAIDFSDTFDNLDHEIDKENVEEIPLFVDVEPVHFTQPPRYSYAYKRKRNASLSTSGEFDDDNEIPDEHRKRTKKKKLGKAKREQKKELDQWAKSMNSTFDEIEHFDLLVE